jgi:acyl-CoA synthetase (AMP-forming)/AMP-acid ligase II
VGRLKDVIIRIGDKILPTELEEFFQDHPGVQEAQVTLSKTRTKFLVRENQPPVLQIITVYNSARKELRSLFIFCSIMFS